MIKLLLPISLWICFCTIAQADQTEKFEIDSSNSWIQVWVYSAGSMQSFGHNHVVSNHDLKGTIWLGKTAAESALKIKLYFYDFHIDDPELRDAAGDDFPGQVSAKDIEGTRKNMLAEKLLDANRFPEIRIMSTSIAGEFPDLTMNLKVMLAGRSNSIRTDAKVSFEDNLLEVAGKFELRHSDIGLVPFSAFQGLLKVRDELNLSYRITAIRTD